MRIRTWKNCGITSSACQRFSPLPPSWLDLLCKAYCPVNFFNLYIGNLQSFKSISPHKEVIRSPTSSDKLHRPGTGDSWGKGDKLVEKNSGIN